MGLWKRNGNSLTTKYSGNRKIISDFLGTNGKVSLDTAQMYNRLYKENYPYPIKISVYKIIVSILLFVFTGVMFLSPVFNENIVFFANFGLVVFSFISLSFVGKVKYPNEQFPIWYLLLISVISFVFIGVSYFTKETMISNLYFIKIAYNKNYINGDLFFELNSIMNIFVLIACILSMAFLLLGILIGKKRFCSAITPLISIGGFLLFCFVANAILEQNIINNTIITNSDINKINFLLVLGILSLCIYDLVLLLFSKKIGGSIPKERR